VLFAFDPGDIRCEIAVMLKEVEVSPRELLEVMGLAQLSALRTREP
jgi:hypothetical protein